MDNINFIIRGMNQSEERKKTGDATLACRKYSHFDERLVAASKRGQKTGSAVRALALTGQLDELATRELCCWSLL